MSLIRNVCFRSASSCLSAFLLLVICSVVHVDEVRAGNWGHWRGPHANGTAPDAKPPVEWSSTKNVRWKVEIPGKSASSPVVWDQQVFTVTSVPNEEVAAGEIPTHEFVTHCFNRADGKELWRKVAVVAKPHQKSHDTNGYSGASPCTDGNHVYSHFGSRGLYCYTMQGDLVWKRDDFGQMETLNRFGEGSSPTIEGDVVLVPWDHEGKSALFALNKLTGDTIWKIERDEPTGWATPLVVEHAGRKQVIMNGRNFARSYDLESGKELWRCSGQTVRPVATPVAENGVVYIGSGFQGAFMGAFHLDGKGDIKGKKQVVWTLDHDCPDMSSPLLTSGRIFFHKGKSALISCIDAKTGQPHFMVQRIQGLDTAYASPVAAAGYVYLTARSGFTGVIRDSDKFELVATNSVDEIVSGTPALADKELFLRGEKHLFCIAEE